MPPPFMPLDPVRATTELVFALIVILICLLIYFRTKEMYSLTKYKGIGFFRNTFLFFALAYFFRFMFVSIQLMSFTTKTMLLPGITHIPLTLVGIFSSLAIVELTVSIIWKESMKYMHYILYSIVAIISIGSSLFKNPLNMLIMQLFLFIFVIVLTMIHLKKSKKGSFSRMAFTYVLLFIFWLASIFVLALPFHPLTSPHTLLYIFSTVIFVFIYLRVRKWTK